MTLDHGFLLSSGVLGIVSQAYRQERGRPQDLDQLQQWFAMQPAGQKVVFDGARIGILPHYYPLTLLGQQVVIRVYEAGQERALAPVSTVLERGKINECLRYQVISQPDFDALLMPDDLRDWFVTRPSVTQPLKALDEKATLEQLDARNWVWRSLKTRAWELTQAQALRRIRKLKKRLPILREALQRLKIERPINLYALGSSLWGREPNDLDLVVVTEGNRPFEVLMPYQTERYPLPLHMRVIGIETLNRAINGHFVENYHRIRIEAMILYGSAVLLAGDDLFATRLYQGL